MNEPEHKPYLDPMPFIRRHRLPLTSVAALFFALLVLFGFRNQICYGPWVYTFEHAWWADLPPGIKTYPTEVRVVSWFSDGRTKVFSALPEGHPELSLAPLFVEFLEAPATDKAAAFDAVRATGLPFIGMQPRRERRRLWDWAPVADKQTRHLTDEQFKAAAW
ncbi:MAG: hypothetical protein AAF581_21900 [Planctomycetota bacterium]